jgi:adenylylsulfate kinase-like enzyme
VPIFVDASFETCAGRDPKGLYAKAKAGQIASFSGQGSPFEPPAADEAVFRVATEQVSPAQASLRSGRSRCRACGLGPLLEPRMRASVLITL